MKHIYYLIPCFLLLCDYACSQDIQEKSKTDILSNYNLIWQDEFNEAPNTNGTLPLPGSQWWFETGNHGWGNNEPQNYVDRILEKDTVAKIQNGSLIITAFKLETPYQGSDIISARMNTTKSWKYGYFEMRAKLPGGKGTWSAFWMLPKNIKSWPLDGEIDIMEYVGYKPGVVHASVHTDTYNHKIGTEKTKTIDIETAETEFHVYGLEWTEDFITGYVDNVAYFTFKNDKKGNKNTWPFNEPFYLKLNLAIGGDWGGTKGIDPDIFPARYEIDYVRVYQKQ
ncbi:family 16 glycosylhydrolase [Dysgonomonas sp. ZJ709]|uniref:glycoside hydrolase family 16 protein n=1 Tax=Dysgonomonas sp. ZJ709 TaxID=2709797 RepID=UPI0013EDEAD4|nr:glycoside hydrolase family 16 protein [Dysgonomonas sp. ZJ709]